MLKHLKLPVLLTYVFLVASILFIAGSSLVHAAGTSRVDKWLESLGPLAPQDRAAFDRAAQSMYRPDCDCFMYIRQGKTKIMRFPIDDRDRRLLIEGIKRGFIMPLSKANES